MKQCRHCVLAVVFLYTVLALFGESFTTETSSSAAKFCHNPSFPELLDWREASSDILVTSPQSSVTNSGESTSELALLRFRRALHSAQLRALKRLSESLLHHRSEYGDVSCINCSCKSGKRYFKHSRRRVNEALSTQGNSRREDARCHDVLNWPLTIAFIVAPLAFVCFFLAVRLHLLALRAQQSTESSPLPVQEDFSFDVAFPARDNPVGDPRRRITRWSVLVRRLSNSRDRISEMKRGLCFSEIQSLPTERYEASTGTNPPPIIQCAICLNIINHGDEIQRIPGCGHYFHRMCLIPWVQISATCPLCRKDVIVKR